MMETQQARQIDLRILGEALVNPKAALMHLTIEIDRELRKLLVSAGVLKRYLNLASPTLPNGVEILRSMGSVVPKNLEEAIDAFWSLRNSAVHNADFQVPPWAFDKGLRILHILEEVPRPRYVVKKANVPLYSDKDCQILREDVKGVMLQTFDANGDARHLQVFPTFREYVDGQSVGWEWSDDFKHGWDDTWYKDPQTQQCTQAFNSSIAFMGRDLNEV
jgi:hypothetical protein